MERVRAGDLTARVPAQSHDEIGRLTDGFNSMVESLQKTTEELRESHERQIQQAGKLASIGELASGIAHEIRNPLAGIGAAVEVLAESAKDREIVGEIRKQINRLSATLRGLLDFSRPSEPEIMPCDVGELLKPMLALTRPDAQKANVQIITECPDNLPPISADPQQLQQAILNILLNAIQAMPHGGTLTVRTDLHVNRLRLSIRDTGVGIPRENRERIFSPFFTTKHHGTGLGLAITRSIIEKNGGTIAVESEVGRGTTVFMEFPVSKQEASDAKNQSAGH
jgi:signal transduction histidine kinase